jgi:hypothetical protein
VVSNSHLLYCIPGCDVWLIPFMSLLSHVLWFYLVLFWGNLFLG